MLIRFCVENFLSFRDEVEFSMVAGASDEHPDHVHEVRDMKILKTGVIFGPNASGKTNLIKAMSFAQEFITKGTLTTEVLNLTPFLLDSESAAKPSEFMFEIQCGIAQCFQYYFSVDSQRVHKESLYEMFPDSERMLFTRETDAEGHTDIQIDEDHILATNEEDLCDLLRELSNPRQLILTQYKSLEERLEEQRILFLEQIYDWFNHTLVLVFPDSIPTQGIGFGIMKDADFRHKLREVLDFLDLGIDDVSLEKIEFDVESELTEDFREHVNLLVQQIPKNSKERVVFGRYGNEQFLVVDATNNYSAYKLVTLHQVNGKNGYVAFDLAVESDGTRRLLKMLPTLLGIHGKQSEHVFVVDELDRSIHAQLSCKVVELFLHMGIINRSQLIVTSHYTGLLDLELLRQDEIWFIEKDKHGASSVFSLEEFILPEKMNIEKGYLFGRFGAIPIIPSIESLEWVSET